MDLMHEKIVNDVANEFIADANESLTFNLVRVADDMERGEFFHPDMTHQIYGDGEQIFGYKDLSVKLFITAGRLSMYCSIEYSEVVRKTASVALEPDDIIDPLSKLLPPNTILDNRDTFEALVKKETTFKPFGEQLSVISPRDDQSGRKFEIYYCTADTPGFLEYFERLQMFTMFYVDAASYIDTEDDRWRYFLAFERYQTPDGNQQFAFVGFTTVYEFYGYPEHVRPRISQMLVLPPFQKMGVATGMLQAVYTKYIDDPKVLTISVEDPSAVFGSMRLRVDCLNCMTRLKVFAVDQLKGGITKEHYEAARTTLKLNKENTLRVFNVLRFRATKRNNAEDYKSFRLFIKNQLYAQFRRQDKELAKLEKYKLSKEEISETLSFVPKEKRPEIIHQEYLDLEAKLLAVVDKLPALSDEEKKLLASSLKASILNACHVRFFEKECIERNFFPAWLCETTLLSGGGMLIVSYIVSIPWGLAAPQRCFRRTFASNSLLFNNWLSCCSLAAKNMEPTSTANECCLCSEICWSRQALHRHHVETHTLEEMSTALMKSPLSVRNRRSRNDRQSKKLYTCISPEKFSLKLSARGKLRSKLCLSKKIRSKVGVSQRKLSKYDDEKGEVKKNTKLTQVQKNAKTLGDDGIDIKMKGKKFMVREPGAKTHFIADSGNVMEMHETSAIHASSDQTSLVSGSAAKIHRSTDNEIINHTPDSRLPDGFSAGHSSDIDIMGSCAPRDFEDQCELRQKLDSGRNFSNLHKWSGTSKADVDHSSNILSKGTTTLDTTDTTADCTIRVFEKPCVKKELLKICDRSLLCNVNVSSSEAQAPNVSRRDDHFYCESRSSGVDTNVCVQFSNGVHTFDAGDLRSQKLSSEKSGIDCNSEILSQSWGKRKFHGWCHSSNGSEQDVHCDLQKYCKELRTSSDINRTVPNLLESFEKNTEISENAFSEQTETLVGLPQNTDNFSEPYVKNTNCNAEHFSLQPKSYCLANSVAQSLSSEILTLEPKPENATKLALPNRSQTYEDETRAPDAMNVISFWTQNLSEKCDDELTSSQTLLPAPQKIMGQMMSDMTDIGDEWPELGDDITLIDDEELLSSLDLFPSLLDDFVIELSTLEGTGALTVQNSDNASAATLRSGQFYGKECLSTKSSCKRNENIDSDQRLKYEGENDQGNYLVTEKRNIDHISGKNLPVGGKFIDNFCECWCKKDECISSVCRSDVLSKRYHYVRSKHAGCFGKYVEICPLLCKDSGKKNVGDDASEVACDECFGEISGGPRSQTRQVADCGCPHQCDELHENMKNDGNRGIRTGTNSASSRLGKYLGCGNCEEKGCYDCVGRCENGCAFNADVTLSGQKIFDRRNEGDCTQYRQPTELTSSSNTIDTIIEQQTRPLEKSVDKNLFSGENCPVGVAHTSETNNVEHFEEYSVHSKSTYVSKDHEVVSQPILNIKSSIRVSEKTSQGESSTSVCFDSPRIPKIQPFACTARSSFFSGKSIFSLNHSYVTTSAPSRYVPPHHSIIQPPVSSLLSPKSDFHDAYSASTFSTHDDFNSITDNVSSRLSEDVRNTCMESSSLNCELGRAESEPLNLNQTSNRQSHCRVKPSPVKTSFGRIVKSSRKSDFFYNATENCDKSLDLQLTRTPHNAVSSDLLTSVNIETSSPLCEKSIVLVRSGTSKIQLKNAKLTLVSKSRPREVTVLGKMSQDGVRMRDTSNRQNKFEFPNKSSAISMTDKPSIEATSSKTLHNKARRIDQIKTSSKNSRQKHSAGSIRNGNFDDGRTRHHFECSYCGDLPSLESLLNVEDHDQGHHKVCLTCHKGLYRKTLNTFKKLVFTHLPKREKCPVCDAYVNNVARHFKRVHQQVRVQCDVCHEYVKKDCLKSHKNRKHSRISSIICDHCGKTFKSAMSLKEHLYRVRHKIKSVLDCIFDEQ
ncbi:Histone acetyl transferase HAT1 N-terminal [Trinorchestia longiramus]|nr:Histone acetyl transferase HAT1 N-terminal [Trinorchestia longiramus]